MFLGDIVKGGVTGLISSISNVVDEFNYSDEEKAKFSIKMKTIENQFIQNMTDQFQTLVKQQTNIIIAEAQGGSWMQKNWRPILMLTITAIIANNYLLVPYASMFTDKVTMLELPEKLWSLMTLGVGGYITGRSIENSIEKWKGKK